MRPGRDGRIIDLLVALMHPLSQDRLYYSVTRPTMMYNSTERSLAYGFGICYEQTLAVRLRDNIFDLIVYLSVYLTVRRIAQKVPVGFL